MTRDEIIERVEQFIRKKPRTRVCFNVNPRYSGGSPAMVGFGDALRVAINEQEEYEDTIEGMFGEEHRNRAEQLGLTGIVECCREKRKCWDVLDLITGVRRDKPFQRDEMTKHGE